VFDEVLVRRLTILKVWHDVVLDGRGDPPFDPKAIIQPRAAGSFDDEAIGYLTRPIDISGWIASVRGRYGFVVDLDSDEREVARCNYAQRDLVDRMIRSLQR
jgi:hypothetical protein